MKIWGQIILVMVSIIFTAYQKIVSGHPFFTTDFFIFTLIAWAVGWQYDLARNYSKNARASEESYKQLLDSLPEAIIIHVDSKTVYANHAAVHLFGAKSKQQVLGLDAKDFISPEYQGRYLERMKQAKKEKQPLMNIEYKLKRLDGSAFFFESSALHIHFGGKEAVLTMGKDITERKEKTERYIQKSEKLALIGQMAAGLAHEIRNPLTSIKGFIQLFKSDSDQQEYYDIVLGELERINNIVGEFLVLAKPSADVFSEKDINVLILDIITLINSESSLNNVQIYVDYEPDLPMVSCEENQLKQVFINLLKNAIEAMPEGGNIFVKIQEKEDGKISVKIKDNGIGIPEERISTLGEPFYTTKEKGTGLGLMTCYKIIESHQGEILIKSKVNDGTLIEVLLPTITQPLLKIN